MPSPRAAMLLCFLVNGAHPRTTASSLAPRPPADRRPRRGSCRRWRPRTASVAGRQGGDAPGGVLTIAAPLRAQDLFERDRLALRLQVVPAAAGALLGAGRDKDLALGLGKGDRALVPPLGDDVLAAGPGPLQGDQPCPHPRIVGRVPRHRRDCRRADAVGHVLAVEQDAVDRSPRDRYSLPAAPIFGQSQSIPRRMPARPRPDTSRPCREN